MKMKKVAILQSNYIPWKGYFDIINDVDLFVFYDDVQYTKRDWRNRNIVKTKQGKKWLTIPVDGNRAHLINEVRIIEENWKIKHFETIKHCYSQACFFKYYKDFIEHIYMDNNFYLLSDFNQYFIKKISNEILGINTEFQDSGIYNASGQKNERLIDILNKANTSIYISGPAAKEYIENEKFAANNIKIVYKDYTGYPEYPQLHGEFNHFVTILDLIFNVGPDTPYYIWGWREFIK